MTRSELLAELAQLDRQALASEHCLAQQREVVEALAESGSATAEATELLSQFQEMQAIVLADRRRLRDQLAAMRPH